MRWILIFAMVMLCLSTARAADPNPAPPDNQAFAGLAFGTIDARTVHGTKRAFMPFYTYYVSPHTITAKGRIYCTFQNTQGRPVVMAYDINGEQWEGPVLASDKGLGGDAHGNPAIYLDRDGYIHIFFGCHTKDLLHTRSVRPYDITDWQEQSSPTPRCTYPQVYQMADGSVSLFYRAGGHVFPWEMRISRDGCQTWDEPEKVIEMRLDPPDPLAAAYAHFFPGADGQTIHCFWVHKDDNPGRINRGAMESHPWRPLKYPGLHEAVYRYNLYYLQRDVVGVWRNAAGRRMDLPVSKAAADRYCRVIDSGDEFLSPNRLLCDSQNRPYARYSIGVRDWTTGLEEKQQVLVPSTTHYVRWNGIAWDKTDAIPAGWPEDAVSALESRGVPGYGDTSHGRWFLWASRAQNNPDVGYWIYLRHEDGRFAVRSGGPAVVQ